MKTDIERLHRVVEGVESGRGSGKTFARCHELAGCIEVGEKLVFCVVTTMNDVSYLRPLIHEVLGEHGIYEQWVNRATFFADGATIKIILEKDFYRATRGSNGAIVYMRHGD